MKTIIKGMLYKAGDRVVRPHFSGEYYMVDCTEYLTKEQIEIDFGSAGDEFFGEDGFNIRCEGVDYWEAESGPYHTEDFDLLSDLSHVDHYDDETNF
jgi:hypothetical protein